MLVYMCACRLRLCVRSGLRLRLTHHLSRPPPTTMPCRWRMPPCVGDFSRAGQDARASAGPLSAVDWRGLALLALLGPDCGVGGLWVPGPGPGPPWDGRPVEPAACRHGTWGAYTVAVGGPAFGLSSALFWVEAAVSLRWFSWGSRALGVSGCLGPGSFPCLLHALRDGAVVPHTHY